MPVSQHNYKACALLYLASKGEEWASSKEVTEALRVHSQSMGSILYHLTKAGFAEVGEEKLPHDYYTKAGNPMRIMRKTRVYRITAKGLLEARRYR